MRVALLLTGQMRTFELVKYIHMNILISKYNTDIFLSIDLDNSSQNAHKNSTIPGTLYDVERAIEFFKPINYYICHNYSIEFENLTKECKQKYDFDIDFRKILFEQYYVVNKAYEMLKNHIQINNVKYDIIMRLRFDQYIETNETYKIINNLNLGKTGQILYNKYNIDVLADISQNFKITFNEIKKNNIYVFGVGLFKHYMIANDQFWYHDHDLIEIISKFYENMPILCRDAEYKQQGNMGAFIEHIWWKYLNNNSIIIKKSNIEGTFVREFE